MAKKLWALVLAVVLAVSMFTAVSAANNRVEIEFCVGDDTLTINGEAVTVEKPYVVGEGVTLVPVRVITEAFGAEVGWEEATQTVTLKYPDVDIVLQIGNPVAEVNGKSETLLAAPELPGESTMVPLRFISENFGAEVSYEEETERITVVKELVSDDSSTVESGVDNKYIGDSYYNWRMENPKDMIMDNRYFDGTYTSFMYDENNWIDVSVYEKDEEYNFDKSYSEWKSYVDGYTLVRADKDTSDSSKQTIHIQAKDKVGFYEAYEIATEKYVYIVMGEYENEKTDIKNECMRILSTFDTEYLSIDTYDLSNVKNGVRRFEAETVKLSFDVPASYVMASDENVENYFYFVNDSAKDNVSSISVAVYSKDSVGGADALANYDFTRNKDVFNEEVAKFDESVVRTTYKNIKTHEYNYEITTADSSEYNRDAFFEIGDYVYNIHICVQMPNENKVGIIKAILNSVEAEQLDFSEVGPLLRNDLEVEGTYTSDELMGCTIEFPNDYEEWQASNTRIYYSDGVTIFYGSVYTDMVYTLVNLKSVARNLEDTQREAGATIVQGVDTVTIGNKKYVTVCCKKEINGVVGYIETYFTEYQGNAYVFEVIYPEIGYSKSARGEAQDILASIIYE